MHSLVFAKIDFGSFGDVDGAGGWLSLWPVEGAGSVGLSETAAATGMDAFSCSAEVIFKYALGNENGENRNDRKGLNSSKINLLPR